VAITPQRKLAAHQKTSITIVIAAITITTVEVAVVVDEENLVKSLPLNLG